MDKKQDTAGIIERLERLGNKPCWIWPRSLDKSGRGRIWVNGKLTLAHRAVWEEVNGKILAGKLLCHHCDNPSCVNPSHLYVGTHADNMRDMKERKRYFAAKEPERVREIARRLGESNTWHRGEGNPRSVLSAKDAKTIKSSKEKTKVLAERYGVHRTTIQQIRRGTTWAKPALRARAHKGEG